MGSDKMMGIFENILSQNSHVLESMTEEAAMNQKLEWLFLSQARSMSVTSAEEALELFLQSRRIYWDLNYDLKYPDEFSLHIIVREWVNIPLKHEFRAFVHRDTITALSQYFTQLYFEELQSGQDELKDMIVDFWKRIKSIFPFGDEAQYCIDFAIVHPENGEPHVVVLELNPLNISTSAALFDWESEVDSDIIYGKLPFEFRVRTSPIAHSLRNKLHPKWAKVMYE